MVTETRFMRRNKMKETKSSPAKISLKETERPPLKKTVKFIEAKYVFVQNEADNSDEKSKEDDGDGEEEKEEESDGDDGEEEEEKEEDSDGDDGEEEEQYVGDDTEEAGGGEAVEEESDGDDGEEEEQVQARESNGGDPSSEGEGEQSVGDDTEEAGGGEAVSSTALVDKETAKEDGDSDNDSSLSEYDEDTMPLKPQGMYFNTTSYQVVVKLGTKCLLKDTFETLDNLNPPLSRSERAWFEEHPQFKHLFHMPKYLNHKVQGMWMLLLRTAEIEKRKEAWFIVNGVPVRYGLREHALISGLDCRNYPLGYREWGNLNFVKRHFGVDPVRREDVKAKLINMGPNRDRLKIIVLFFLSSIVCGQTKCGDGAPEVLDIFKKAVVDLDYCKSFPWGRFSFDYMLSAIRHTAGHFRAKKEVRSDVQWAIPGFCIPLELLAFECILDLRREFRETVPGADKMCPRMCKSKFKKGDMKGFPLSEINEALGKTKDIDSVMIIHEEEENDLLDQIYEEDDDDDVHDIVVDSWSRRIRHGYTVFFEDMFNEDVAARTQNVLQPLPSIPKKRKRVPMPPTDFSEILKTIKAIEKKVNGMDKRLAGLEASVEDLKAKSNEE